MGGERAVSGGRREPATRTRWLPAAARVVLGLLFTVTGLNGFFNFLPQPASMPEGAIAFAGALIRTGYLFQFIMGTQIVAGLLLLADRFVPLALAVLAPIVGNAVAFHVFLGAPGLALALFALALELYLAWAYRGAYRPMLAMRATPDAT